MTFFNEKFFDALNQAHLHSTGSCTIGSTAALRADPDAPRLEWFHCLIALPCEHVIVLVGPTGLIRFATLEDDDIFPCDVDLNDPVERDMLWRMWRKSYAPLNRHSGRTRTALNRLRSLVRQVA
jgi:hypothetical protein